MATGQICNEGHTCTITNYEALNEKSIVDTIFYNRATMLIKWIPRSYLLFVGLFHVFVLDIFPLSLHLVSYTETYENL
jgi:hypothetical protein